MGTELKSRAAELEVGTHPDVRESDSSGSSSSSSGGGGGDRRRKRHRKERRESRELMQASAAAATAKKQCLAALKRGGGGDDFAGAIGREYAEHRGGSGGRRIAYDAANYMKPDSGF